MFEIVTEFLIYIAERPKSRVYQIGVNELSELSDLLTSTNNVLARNSNLRASLTISAVKRSVSSASKRRSVRQKYQLKPECLDNMNEVRGKIF